MSVRQRKPLNVEAEGLQRDLATLREAAISEKAAEADRFEATVCAAEASKAFESLTHTEQAAASLGVHPDAWKPISFMNTAHYGALLRANALDDTLARRIEAFKTVSTA